jgi:autotransporter-associated beta strand protein
MKSRALFGWFVSGFVSFVSVTLQGSTVDKAATGSTLTDAASWGGSVPGASDVVNWSSGSLGAGLVLNDAASWQGIRISGALSDVGISGSGTLTLGSGGLNLEGSTVNASISNNIVLAESQTWRAAAGKSITASGVISGTGAITLGHIALSSTYSGYLTSTVSTIFTGTTLADVVSTNGLMGGAYVAGGGGNYLGSQGYLLSNDGTTATYQLRVLDGGFTKSVKVELTQVGSDIQGRVVYARYINGSNLNNNFDTNFIGGTIATSNGAAGYGTPSTTLKFGIDSLGSIILSGTNTYTGATTITTAVQVGSASVGGVGGALGFHSPVALVNAPGVSLDLNGFATHVGSLTGAGTAGGNVLLGESSLTLGADNSSPAAYAGVISGTGGSLVKVGTGTQILSGNNTYSGGTNVESGTLIGTSNAAFGTGAITVGAGPSDATILLGNRADISNAITVSGAGTGLVTIGADNSGSGSNAASFLGPITLNRPTTITGQVAADRLALDGRISGNVGTLTISGGSRTTLLSTSNDFVGDLVIEGSGTILQASVATTGEVIPNGSDVTVGAGAVFQLASSGGGAETIDGLFGSGVVRTFPTAVFGSGLIVGSADGDGDFSGQLVNGASALSLTKTGSGTQTLSGNSTYTGATLVSAGTLLVTGSLGVTAVTVGSAGIIGGDGLIQGALNILDGGKIAVELGSYLTVNGSVTFANLGLDDLDGIDVETIPQGTYTILEGSNISTANIANLGLENAFTRGDGRQVYFQSGSLQLVVIPEPAAMLLGSMGFLLILRRRRP